MNMNIIPIQNMPEKYLTITLRNKQVKMKNLLTYAFNQSKNQDGVLWHAIGDDIEKMISFVEIFKRKNTEFKNQINKLRFKQVESKDINGDVEMKNVSEMFIFLSKDMSETNGKESSFECNNLNSTSKNLTNETLITLTGLKLESGKKRCITNRPLKSMKASKKRKFSYDRK